MNKRMVVSLILGALGLGIASLLGYQLVSAVAVVVHWTSIGLGIGIALGLLYNLYTKNYLEPFFSTEEFEVLSGAVVSGVVGFVSFRLLEALFAAFGLLAALLVGGFAVLAVVFSPGFVLGGIETLVEFIVNLTELVSGGN